MPEEQLNRKTRRAAQTRAKSKDVPLAQPDRSGPQGKSLMDLAAERQEELLNRADAINAQRARSTGVDYEHLGNTALWTLSLSMLHLTLDVLVYHQYAERIQWDAIAGRTAIFAPAMGVIIYVSTTAFAIQRWGLTRQVFLFHTSCMAGCYLIRTTNTEPYIAVMRRAPPLGTFLIWAYFEMTLALGIGSFAIFGLYLWYNHFSII